MHSLERKLNEMLINAPHRNEFQYRIISKMIQCFSAQKRAML
jgi:hypothetical protein